MSSTQERRISGALEPSAMSDRFASVAFHTGTTLVSPFFSVIVFVVDVMCSTAFMNASDARPTPTNSQRLKMMWSVTRTPALHSSSASIGMR